jgi:hypothetical protein
LFASTLKPVTTQLSRIEAEIMGVFRLQATMKDGPDLELAPREAKK